MAYICYGHYLSVTNALNHPEILVYCEPGDIYTGEAATLSYRVMLVVTLAAVFNYILMGCMLRGKPNAKLNWIEYKIGLQSMEGNSNKQMTRSER